MNLNLLELESQLWIIAEDTADPWFNYFNWQTQFRLGQYCKQFSDKTSPFLFSGSKRLPTESILIIPQSERWISMLQTNWRSLGEPTTLVFLPQNLTQEQFYKLWPDAKSNAKIRCIQDKP